MTIRNPILPGFNPDPSIVRVGDDYYIATSTFEWFPGVQIHHSRDLVHWRLLTRPLRRASQLNMLGDPDSCGIWAPCLSYADGLFWLIYTDVKRYGRTSIGGASGASLRDFHNYLVTSPRIDGEWSDPVYLNSSGFDPSLFHDDDGRKYLLNMLWDHPAREQSFRGNRHAGILGEGAEARRRAEEHLPGHGDRIDRSAAPLQAQRLVLSAYGRRRHGLGTRGHDGALAKDRRAVRIASRHPRPDVAPSPGRRTAAGRPRRSRRDAGRRDLHGLSLRPTAAQPRPLHARPRDGHSEDDLGRGRLAAHARRTGSADDRNARADVRGFSGRKRGTTGWEGHRRRRFTDASSLRLRRARASHRFPMAAHPVAGGALQPIARPGFLRLFGRETLGSLFRQSLVARRQQSHCLQCGDGDRVRTGTFPADGRPGLLLQQREVPLPLPLARRNARQTPARDVVRARLRRRPTPSRRPLRFPTGRPCICASRSTYERLRFAYRVEGVDDDWRWLPQLFDASILSDEATAPGTPNFTGAFVGMACQDMAGTCRPADFDYFEYGERGYCPDNGLTQK